MASLDSYLDDLLAGGRACFSRDEVVAALGLKPSALAAAITRAINKRRLANPRHGFYLILRPEDQITGAPDPVKWIDPLMKYQGIDYRISLLRAAAFHGASHQASMVFQVVVPKQLRDFDLGRYRLQFLYQGPDAFSQVNQSSLVDQIKIDAGFATAAGVELTLLDCVRYFHKADGIKGVAQVVKEIGAEASPRPLQKAAGAYENSAVRRLGYLLDLAGHARQADALQGFVKRARTALPLDPAVRPLVKALAQAGERNPRWKLLINEAAEIAE
jgi:predicted transcriptional regulator of viral defense system